jgi:hypothetical protein
VRTGEISARQRRILIKMQNIGKNTNHTMFLYHLLTHKKHTERDNVLCTRIFFEKLVESHHVSRGKKIEIAIFSPFIVGYSKLFFIGYY